MTLADVLATMYWLAGFPQGLQDQARQEWSRMDGDLRAGVVVPGARTEQVQRALATPEGMALLALVRAAVAQVEEWHDPRDPGDCQRGICRAVQAFVALGDEL